MSAPTIHRSDVHWRCRDRVLTLGPRARVMGIVNLTPDSFYESSRRPRPEDAVDAALRMAGDGAAVLDLGGESSRPGAEPVPVSRELDRVLPVLRSLRSQTDALISIDTRHAETADAALAAGADIINDITALRDPEMASVVRQHRAGLVLMHMRGEPATMQAAPAYDDVVGEVESCLAARLGAAVAAGISPECVLLDPGIGFGKTTEHNLALLRDADYAGWPRPALLGVSRKSIVGALTGRAGPEERLGGSLGLTAWLLARGAAMFRTHDVKETCDLTRVLDTLRFGDAPRDPLG